ncbi:MAG: type II toxin-antitoxin system VapC family toxin [Campylobacterota bacterium]|nr:type II toxin-antitoxin system VapC family toxin [Campylobacterota bacterium]
MSRNIFVDTNIVLDILDRQRASGHLVEDLWVKTLKENKKIYISEDMITTIFYLSRDKEKTLEFFKIILDDWNIVTFSKDMISKAINLSLENNLDLEDVLQCLCAKENECEVLITNDKQFYDCGVKIMSTKEYIDEK